MYVVIVSKSHDDKLLASYTYHDKAHVVQQQHTRDLTQPCHRSTNVVQSISMVFEVNMRLVYKPLAINLGTILRSQQHPALTQAPLLYPGTPN